MVTQGVGHPRTHPYRKKAMKVANLSQDIGQSCEMLPILATLLFGSPLPTVCFSTSQQCVSRIAEPVASAWACSKSGSLIHLGGLCARPQTSHSALPMRPSSDTSNTNGALCLSETFARTMTYGNLPMWFLESPQSTQSCIMTERHAGHQVRQAESSQLWHLV